MSSPKYPYTSNLDPQDQAGTGHQYHPFLPYIRNQYLPHAQHAARSRTIHNSLFPHYTPDRRRIMGTSLHLRSSQRMPVPERIAEDHAAGASGRENDILKGANVIVIGGY